jgi:hypothetical protein
MIHYHGTPFSGELTARMALRGRHAMVSFADARDIELAAEICQSFALDNGAFSAWTRKEPFDAPGYMAWADKWLKHPGCDFALAPDVIDGTEEENDDMLADCDERFTPVWHLHESLDRLDRLANTWRRVALGSSGRFAKIGTPQWWGRIAEAMEVVTDDNGMPVCKLHGLRMLDPAVFSHIPFASADSTNVARNIGMDSRWSGTYMPRSKQTRALVMIDRIESHAAAHRWNREAGAGNNQELFG